MTAIDDFLANNAKYAERFDKGHLPMPPARHIAVVACMDARLETGVLLGLVEGDAHVIRNAGGVVTDDVIRSLVISQRLLGTREIMLIHHTDCGMGMFTLLDAYRPSQKALVKLSSEPGAYFHPELGEPAPLVFIDEESLESIHLCLAELVHDLSGDASVAMHEDVLHRDQ